MPIYEFRCLQCGNLFEKLFTSMDQEFDVACPQCRSKTFERVISRSNHMMSSGKGGPKTKVTTKSCGGGNGCVTLDIPGPD